MTEHPPARPTDGQDLLGPLGAWVGTWRGGGRGHFPTIEPFTYTEEVVFGATGKPVLAYRQRTRAADGRPLHAESGWVRLVGSSAGGDGPVEVEWVLAQPTGLVEAGVGTLVGGVLDVVAVPERTPSAVVVTDVRRRYAVDGDELGYDLWMATERVPDRTHHLAASLRRDPPGTT